MVSGAYPPDQLGGAEMQCRKLSTALAAVGHDVTVLTSCRRRRDAGTRDEDGVRVIRVWSRHPPQHMGPRTGSSIAWTAGALWSVRGFAFDVVHSHQAKYPAAVGALIAARRGVPNLAKVGDSDHKFDLATLERKSVVGPALARYVRTRVDLFVAITAPIESELRGRHVAANRVVRIPNGVVDVRGLARVHDVAPDGFATPTDAVVLLYLGRLAREKNLDRLLEACAALGGSVEVHIVGDGPLLATLRRQTRDLATTRVVFHGRLDDPGRAIAASDFLVLPSLAEGLSNSLLEGAIAGLPAVATPVGGNPEVVIDGVTGFLARDTSVGGVREALERAVACSPDERRKMSAAIRRHALENFEMSKVVERYEDVYAEIVSS